MFYSKYITRWCCRL